MTKEKLLYLCYGDRVKAIDKCSETIKKYSECNVKDNQKAIERFYQYTSILEKLTVERKR